MRVHAFRARSLDSAQDTSEVAAAYGEAARLWREIDAPEPVVLLHLAVADGYERVADELPRQAITSDEQALMFVRDRTRHQQADWLAAVEREYGLIPGISTGPSMTPTFCLYDPLIFSVSDGAVERWQVVLVRPYDSDERVVKRVVALNGETLAVSNGTFLVNGREVDDPVDTPDLEIDSIAVPPNELFLLGDNRANSEDSRVFGTVPTERVVGELPADARGCNGQ